MNCNLFAVITSKITDHRDHITNMRMKKVWNIAGITKMWHRDMKWTNAAGKMALIDFLDEGLPQTFNLSKTQYLHSAIKWTAVRWGVPV